MKSALAMTRPTAASTSDRISAYCAFRSTSGICSAADTLSLTPHVRPLEESLEAHKLPDLLEHTSRASAHNGAGRHVARDDRPGPDQRPGADLHTGQDRGVATDAHVVLHGRAEDTLEVARACWMGIVR